MAPGYGTASVALAATPAVVSTFFNHIATWPKRHIRHRRTNGGSGGNDEKEGPSPPFTPATSLETLPGQQLRYEEGLHVVKSFLNYASMHAVEEVQDFTAQPVPVPHWVRREVVTIPEDVIERAAEILIKHLSSYGDGKGIELVGGTKWWKIRGRELEAEWIEVAKNFTRRTTQSTMTSKADKRRSFAHLMGLRPRSVRDDSGGDVISDRVILYIHGGAFFFSSLDLHRYQIQRHARKAGARAFVPNYRLSPQYPFPCGLLDSLAAYLYLIEPPQGVERIAPSNIIFMGDSAGGGMCLSLLVLIREMGLPMPAACSLMSPWVDLTHSMPSIMEWDGGDYIPSVGFHHKPSAAWPPIPGDGITVTMPDGKEQLVEEQIQLYCPNKLLTHPLVSTINNGSLGGLPPLYISAGSVELLRDEIIYIAHKASAPSRFPPAPATLEEYPEQAALVDKYPPTKVHLQVFEGACHVATTLAWTRSAKHIFRGTANFNIWAFKAACKADESQSHFAPGTLRFVAKTAVSPLSTANNSRAPSVVSSAAGSEDEASASSSSEDGHGSPAAIDAIKVWGVEPQFGMRTIVSERVSTRGRITPMEAEELIPALNPALRPEVGRIRGNGPIQTWLKKRAEWDKRFGAQLKHWRGILSANRVVAERRGFLTGTLQGENPPRSALASLADRDLARRVGRSVDEPTTSRSTSVALWMKIGEKADEEAMEGKHRRASWVKHNVKDVGRRASQAIQGNNLERTSSERRRSWHKSSNSSRRNSMNAGSPSLTRTTSPAARHTAVPGSPKPTSSARLSSNGAPTQAKTVPAAADSGPATAPAPAPVDPVAAALASLTMGSTAGAATAAPPAPSAIPATSLRSNYAPGTDGDAGAAARA